MELSKACRGEGDGFWRLDPDGGAVWQGDFLEDDGGVLGEGGRRISLLFFCEGVEVEAANGEGGTVSGEGVGDWIHFPRNMLQGTVIF